MQPTPLSIQDHLTIQCEQLDLNLVFLAPASDYEASILGVIRNADGTHQVVYSRRGVLGSMMAPVQMTDGTIEPGMDSDEAAEFYDFNTAGAYVAGGPVFSSDGIDDPEITCAPGELREWLEARSDDGDTITLLEPEFDPAIIGCCEGICAEAGALYSLDILRKLISEKNCSSKNTDTELAALLKQYPHGPGSPKWLATDLGQFIPYI